MSKPLKILYCTDQLYKHGGTERVTTTKLNGWIEYTDNEIHLVTIEQKNNPFRYGLDSRVKIHDLEINYYRDVSYFSMNNFKKTCFYIYRLCKIIRSLKPDVIVCVNSGPVNLFLPYIVRNCVTINEYHASRINEYKLWNAQKIPFVKKAIYKLAHLAEKRFTICVVLNESELKYFSSNNVKVIPNPILIPKYEKHIREKVVVAAGRIAKVKGYNFLIEAWEQVSAIHPDWILHIYGDGDDILQKELEEQAKGLCLQDRIKFCGVTSNLNHVFFTSSIHVLSSYEESFGMVIVEAQACGLPSVAFNCPTGPGNLIKDGVNGFLVIPQDSNALSKNLKYLIENPKIRLDLGNNAILNARKYAVSSIIENWCSLFKNLKYKK